MLTQPKNRFLIISLVRKPEDPLIFDWMRIEYSVKNPPLILDYPEEWIY